MHKTLRYGVLWLLASCTIEVPLGTSGVATILDDPPALREQPKQDAGNANSSAPAPNIPAAPKPSPIPAPSPSGEPSSDDWKPGDEASWPSFGRDLEQSRAAESEDEMFVRGRLAPLWTRAGAAITATPVVFGGVVYWGDWDGKLQAARADNGQLLWEAKLDSRVTSSAFATDALVYVAEERGTVHAFDRITGAARWKNTVSDHARARLWSSPMVVDGALIIGVSRVLGAAGSQARFVLLCLNAKTGETRWETEAATSSAVLPSDPRRRRVELTRWSTAAIDVERKRAYVAAGRGRGPLPTGFEVLAAVDYESGELSFTVDLGESNTLPAPTPANDTTSEEREFHADSAPLLFPGEGDDTNPSGSRDLIGIGGLSGTYGAFSRDDGRVIWTAALASAAERNAAVIMGAAAHVDGRILVAVGRDESSSQLVSLDALTGMRRWQSELDGIPTGALAVAGDAVLATVSQPALSALVGTLRSSIVSRQVTSGMAIGSSVLSSGSLGGIAIADGRALVGTGTAPNGSLASKGALEVHAPR